MTLPAPVTNGNGAYAAPIAQEIFNSRNYGAVPPNGFMAKMGNPADGFTPFRTQSGTEVVFIPSAVGLPSKLALECYPLWQNGLGLVVFRNEAAKTIGAIFIHGAMQTPWSLVQPNAWQALGGIMAFAGITFEDAIEMVLGKGMAMTPKWRFIDEFLIRQGHPIPTNLGGAKAILCHASTVDDKKKAMIVAAEVSQIIGIYISGPDQGTGWDQINQTSWSDVFAAEAPINFMGAQTAHDLYQGMKNPSPFTAQGIYGGLKFIQSEFGGQAPILFQGYGGVGRPLLDSALHDGMPIAGISDTTVAGLRTAQEKASSFGVSFPIFLDRSGALTVFDPERAEAEIARARAEGIPVVGNLRETIERVPSAEILSPNAGSHPISLDVANLLADSAIKAIIGAANNMLGLVDGSPDTVAQRLVKAGIFCPCDSRINQMGALSVTVRSIGLDEKGLRKQADLVAEGVAEEYRAAFRQGLSPQFYSDAKAGRAWNRLMKEGRAIGGYFVPPRVDL